MPELPDVEIFKRYLDSTSLHQRIDRVEIGDERVLKNVSPREMAESLQGRELESTGRRGKYLFAVTDGEPVLVLHFGMTGFPKYYRGDGDRPEHVRLLLCFANGFHLAYDCQRQFGELHLIDSVERFISDKGLGPDAAEVQYGEFAERVGRGRGAVKTTLMNQSVVAGLGNVYTDETLYQAGIHPRADVRGLDGDSLRLTYDKMNYVLDTAVDRKADPGSMPAGWLLPLRETGGDCPNCGAELEKTRISNRATWLCPECQQG